MKLAIKISVLIFSMSLLSACHQTNPTDTKKLVNMSLADMTYIKSGRYTMGYKNSGPTVSVKNFTMGRLSLCNQQ